MYLYGYRNYDVIMPSISAIKENAEVHRLWSKHDDEIRRPVSVSLGCHVHGAVMPHPDMNHFSTTLGGIKKRFLMKPPQTNRAGRRKLRKFVSTWLKGNLTPLHRDSDTSVQNWLKNTNYPLWRKNQLLDLWNKEGGTVLMGKHTTVNSFVKDEFYPEFKHPRLINSRHDIYKVAVGPYFKLIEQELFKLPWFIKKIPVDQRAQYIMNRLYKPNGTYIATDYTAFETHFTKEMMDDVEMQLYKYMTSNLPNKYYFNRLLKVLTGTNHLYSHNFHTILEATRMSGEMNTSLGNGFSNLMFMLFACEDVNADAVTGVVEGDDGLFCVEGNSPTSETFKKMGLTIKLDVLQDISSASFCGLIFDPDDKINITNPVDVLLTFGWTDRKYSGASMKKLKSLLRSKSLSLLYEYKNAPIFQALARYGLRVTEGVRAVSANNFNMYEKDQVSQAYEYYNKHSHILEMPVPLNTRMLMEREFGISINLQIKIENYLDSLDNLTPLCIEEIVHRAHEHSLQMWDQFVRVGGRKPDMYIRT